MDPSVKTALQRWPDVPAVYGWLSLDGRGRWRLHPLGDACLGGPGESITNIQLLSFIDRNFGCEADGRWFFQNGPQHVYVRLDSAPYILRYAESSSALQTHTGLLITSVWGWYLDDGGQLYAMTDLGPGSIDSRDLAHLLTELHTDKGQTLIDFLESTQELEANPHTLLRHPGLTSSALLHGLSHNDRENVLGFVGNPITPKTPW
jgi:Protein of unknown function (DUF2946)